jgi:hypothetical protein
LSIAGVIKNFDGLVAVNNITYEVFEEKPASWPQRGRQVDFHLLTGYQVKRPGVLSW